MQCCRGAKDTPERVFEATVAAPKEAVAPKGRGSRSCCLWGFEGDAMEDSPKIVQREHTLMTTGQWMQRYRGGTGSHWNANQPADYFWLKEVLFNIISNESGTYVGPEAAAAIPIFIIMGACPSSLAGMQVLTYFSTPALGSVDFWWVKPKSTDPSSLEENTMDYHHSGPHKNSPAASRAGYQPIADRFSAGGDPTFGVCEVKGTPRAFIERDGQKLYVLLIWQEEWSSILALSKYLMGKIVYQKDPCAHEYYTRPFIIQGSGIQIGEGASEEGPFGPEVIPSSTIKDNCNKL